MSLRTLPRSYRQASSTSPVASSCARSTGISSFFAKSGPLTSDHQIISVDKITGNRSVGNKIPGLPDVPRQLPDVEWRVTANGKLTQCAWQRTFSRAKHLRKHYGRSKAARIVQGNRHAFSGGVFRNLDPATNSRFRNCLLLFSACCSRSALNR